MESCVKGKQFSHLDGKERWIDDTDMAKLINSLIHQFLNILNK
jgi:hypothetical protein